MLCGLIKFRNIMVWFPTAVFSGITQGAFTAVSAASALTAHVVRDFFTNLFMHPGDHYMAVVMICVVSIGACVGSAFLIKLVYEKYCPTQPHT